MAHNTLNGGTVTEIGGGKAMLNGTVYQVDSGKALSGGTVYPISFGNECTVTIDLNETNKNGGMLDLAVGIYDKNGGLVDGYAVSDFDGSSPDAELSGYKVTYGGDSNANVNTVMTAEIGDTLKIIVRMDGTKTSYCYIYFNGTQVYGKDSDTDFDEWSTEITGNTTVVNEEAPETDKYDAYVYITMEG